MADFRNNSYQAETGSQASVQYDAGLRSYMLGVYNYMALGIAFTAIVTMAVASSPAFLSAVAGMPWLFFIGIMALSWFGPNLVMNAKSPVVAHAAFWGYAALWGVGITPMVYHYLSVAPNLVVQAFGITAIMFGAMSVIGYTTKKNLSGMAQFAAMAIIGVLIAAVVNYFFLESALFGFIISAVYVVAISAITAWETQAIKNMYSETDNSDVAHRKSIFGAFLLYGSFVSMFIHVLSMIGFLNND